MANVTVSVPVSNVTVTASTGLVTVAETSSNIIVSSSAGLSNSDVRAAISVTDTGGDGSLAYNSTTGVITYTGVSAAETRAHFSATTPITLASGVIGIDSAALFTGKTTDDLAEGTSNIYWSTTGAAVSTTNLTEGTNLYFTDARANTVIGTNTTDNLAEGSTNLYYTSARANTAISAYQGNINTSGFLTAGNVTLQKYQETVYDLGNQTGNITIDGTNGSIQKLVLTGNITGITLTDVDYGGGVTLLIKQGVSGLFTIDTTTYTSNWTNWEFTFNDTLLDPVADSLNLLTILRVEEDSADTKFASLQRMDSDPSTVTYNGVTLALGAEGNIDTFPGNVTVGANLMVSGNLEVTGNINYREVTDLLVQDQTITMNYGNATAQNAQIIVDRSGTGGGSNTDLKWNESTNVWEFTNDGSTYFALPTSTSSIAEGTNLYFTDARANTAIAAYTGAVINLTGNVTTTANVSGAYILGDGSQLTNVSNLTNAQVQTYIESNGLDGTANITTSANVAGAYFIGDGSALTNVSNLTNAQVQTYIESNGLDGTANITTSANISGAYILGDGSALTNISTATVAVLGDTSTDAAFFPTLSSAATGDVALKVPSGKWSFNPAQGKISLGPGTPMVLGDNEVTGLNNITSVDTVDLTFNARGKLIVAQEFAGTNTNTFEVEGDGYAFRPNNITAANELLSYSGSAALHNYEFNGNVALGDANIVVTAMTDKQGGASVVVADVIDQYMVMTNGYLGTTMAPFPMGTYVQSVSGSNVTMSANALSAYEFTDNLFNAGIVDTTRNQAISVISDWTYSGGSNTSIKYEQPTNFDAYGYPDTGFAIGDFAGFSAGSSGDYTFAGSQEAYFKGKTDIMPANTTLNVSGLTVGDASMTGRGENDGLSSFGINALWPGTTSSGYDSQIPQILFKSYTDLTLQDTYTENAGPRLFFQSAYGNADDYAYDTYPRENQELGRISFSGTTGDNLLPSTLRTPAYMTVQAADDWDDDGAVAGNTDLYLAATANRSLGADIILAYRDGRLMICSGKTNTASEHDSVMFMPAEQPGNNPSTAYGTTATQWATINYEDPTNETGAKITVTNGGNNGAGTVGDMALSLKRNDNSGSTTINIPLLISGGYYNYWGLASGDIVVSFPTGDGHGSTLEGKAFTFGGTGTNGSVGSGNESNITSATTYYFDYRATYGGRDLYAVTTDSGLTTDLLYTDIGGTDAGTNYAPQTTLTATYTVASGVTAQEWAFELEEQSSTLELKGNSTTYVTFGANRTDFSNSLRLKNYTTTEINALTGMQAGDTVYNTTLEQICFYDATATAWQKVTSATM